MHLIMSQKHFLHSTLMVKPNNPQMQPPPTVNQSDCLNLKHQLNDCKREEEHGKKACQGRRERQKKKKERVWEGEG